MKVLRLDLYILVAVLDTKEIILPRHNSLPFCSRSLQPDFLHMSYSHHATEYTCNYCCSISKTSFPSQATL